METKEDRTYNTYRIGRQSNDEEIEADADSWSSRCGQKVVRVLEYSVQARLSVNTDWISWMLIFASIPLSSILCTVPIYLNLWNEAFCWGNVGTGRCWFYENLSEVFWLEDVMSDLIGDPETMGFARELCKLAFEMSRADQGKCVPVPSLSFQLFLFVERF